MVGRKKRLAKQDGLIQPNKSGMGNQVISGMIWTVADILGNQVTKLAVQIILARLLIPKDFGIISIITVFIAVSQSIMDSGFQNALIREKETKEEDLATVFYFNFCMSLLIYLSLFFSSPFISRFFNEPKLETILKVVGIIIIINSFGLIQRTILSKQLKFKAQMIINMFSSLLSGVVAIVLASKGFGIWSLVSQIVLMQFIQALLLTLNNRWWPKKKFYWSSFIRLYKFGWKMMATGLVNTIYQNLYFVIIGRLYSASDLGFYTNAQKLRDASDFTITGAVRKVSYPALSKIKENQEVLRLGYQKIIRYTIFFTFPVTLVLISIAPELFKLLFGIKWMASVPYFQVLCLASMFFPLHTINLNILQVKGKSGLVLKLEVINKIIALSLIFISILFHWGITGLIWISVFSSFSAYLINFHYAALFLEYSKVNQFKDILGSLISSLLMFIVLYVWKLFFDTTNIWNLAINCIIAGLSYIICHLIFQTNESKGLMMFFKNIGGRE